MNATCQTAVNCVSGCVVGLGTRHRIRPNKASTLTTRALPCDCLKLPLAGRREGKCEEESNGQGRVDSEGGKKNHLSVIIKGVCLGKPAVAPILNIIKMILVNVPLEKVVIYLRHSKLVHHFNSVAFKHGRQYFCAFGLQINGSEVQDKEKAVALLSSEDARSIVLLVTRPEIQVST